MTKVNKLIQSLSKFELAGGTINTNNGVITTAPINLADFQEAVLFANVSAIGDNDVLQLTKVEFTDSAGNVNTTLQLNQPYPYGNNADFPVGSEYLLYPKENIKVDPLVSAVITKADFTANKPFAKGNKIIIGLQLWNYPFSSKFVKFTFTGSSVGESTVAITSSFTIVGLPFNS